MGVSGNGEEATSKMASKPYFSIHFETTLLWLFS
jgi:hypothetical protein